MNVQGVKDEERDYEERRVAEEYDKLVHSWFTDRELGLIFNCQVYAHNGPSGLPGHNLMIVVNKLCDFFGFRYPDDFAISFEDVEENKDE